MDVHDKKIRSRNMKAIRSRDTKPELLVRKLLHNNGYRYRIAPAKLSGKPDIWLRKWNSAIFINGCFWHGHECEFFRLPKTRTEFWKEKIGKNKLRDVTNRQELRFEGLRVLTIWECALKGKGKLSETMLLTLIKTWLMCNESEAEITSEGLLVRR
ncbi:DNA mismatch endonuclease Vsr [Vibrio rhizosphaerae]|uniref:Very short patch repair endonuclease n=1 Tax=Vibrio rhizosphaerae TaxID=398736 RepID=A0ABU4IVG7_9VIBR|nr:DNA mismatch endonuclease Vsr [Vibrio rhizosphaerae]MDW6092208.1 DNA mismatch endonuclease Vsr [Vibrio rhizosphaerae]